jgi:hypothetical protein
VWAEIWPDLGPRIDGVLATGRATWNSALLLFLERSGYPEEPYHTFSYSPLRDLGSDRSVVRTEDETLAHAARSSATTPATG